MWTPIFQKKAPFKKITPVIGDRFGVQKKQISIGNTFPEIQVRALALPQSNCLYSCTEKCSHIFSQKVHSFISFFW